tara:strand:+ start:5006 stop:5602 length:597 start_codon:yes stop_codon:yes gene_type:complete
MAGYGKERRYPFPWKTCLRVLTGPQVFSTNDNQKNKSKEYIMARKSRKPDPNQINFFSSLDRTDDVQVPPEPTMQPINGNKIKLAISSAIKNSHFDREEICRQMSVLAGREVTVAMLNAYTSQSRTTHQVPSDLLAPMSIVLGSSILKVIANDAGCTIAERMEMQWARIGKFFLMQQQVRQEMEQEINALPLMRRVGQ